MVPKCTLNQLFGDAKKSASRKNVIKSEKIFKVANCDRNGRAKIKNETRIRNNRINSRKHRVNDLCGKKSKGDVGL